jgi:hypothetical protein
VLTPPFILTPDNPVVVYIPLAPGEWCLWASLIADPFSSPGEIPRPGEVPRPAGSSSSIRATLREARLGQRREAGRVRAAAARVGSGMRAEAFVSSVPGPASIGVRDTQPFGFSAPGIIEIRLTGSGDVVGLLWIEGHSFPKLEFEPWRLLALPHRGGLRYLALNDPIARATLRVLEQAPKRQPLQETLGAIAPAAAPAATPADDARRVGSLAAPLQGDLDALITDASESPLLQRVEESLVDGDETIGSANQRRLDRIFQAQLDPGGAALLGYKTYDRDYADTEVALTFYWITGFFRSIPSEILPDPVFDGLIAQLSPENLIGSEKNLVTIVRRLVSGVPAGELNDETTAEIERVTDYIALGALAVVDGTSPPLAVSAPRIDGTTHVGWLPLTPPEAKREVEVALGGVVTGGLLAAEKLTPATGTDRTSLNSTNVDGYHLPIVLGLTVVHSAIAPEPEPGTGTVFDRQAAPDPVRYFVAQQDRFGRWSEWNSAINDPGPRPRPPRPVIRATYTQPADPATTGGTVRVQVDVPPLDSLAPGSFPIAELHVDGTYEPFGGAVAHVHSVGNPQAPDRRIDFIFAGPVLAPTSTRTLRLVAVWRDINNTDSVESEPQTITMHDPRPPAQLPPPPDVLLYSGRPDVTGLSMVEYAWTPAAGQANFAVYCTDENRLTAHLGRTDASAEESALLTALQDAADAAARATLLRANPALFPAHLFERLQGVVFDGATGTKRFVHAVSGSLRVLNIYRVAAEASTNARVDLTTLPLLIYAVPNADPPARPTIEVAPADLTSNADQYAAIVHITLTPGMTEAKTWRLRRSNLGATDALRMPIVSTGVMDEIGSDGRQRAEFTDAGPVQIASTAKLLPWVRYHWVAETQGATAPGSEAAGRPVPGLWSQPSDPASLVLVPPQSPEAVSDLAVSGTPIGDGTFVDVKVTFTHPRALLGGLLGNYRARLERRVPNRAMEMLLDEPVAGAGPFSMNGMRDGDVADAPPADTVYRVVIIDPIGREGTAAEALLV